MLNTLKYAKMLEDVGFSREQAEASIEILMEIMEDKFATKEDIKVLLSELESKLTIRMGVMLTAAVTILATIVTLVRV